MTQNRRLIDADTAFRFFKDQIVKETDAFSKGVNEGLNIAMSVPDAIPSADAVEVVRCKDCVFWKRHTKTDKHHGACNRCRMIKHESGFSDKGERRDNG